MAPQVGAIFYDEMLAYTKMGMPKKRNRNHFLT